MRTIQYFSITLVAGATIFLSGCGASGQQFADFSKPKKDKGLVYIYRPEKFVGSGVYYDVHLNNFVNSDIVIGELVNGSYLESDIDVGENEIWAKTESKSSVTLDVKKGEIYCVKGEVGLGFLLGRPNLSIVNMETCKFEILTTRKPK